MDLSDIPNNLPYPLTSFIGREREINEVTRLLHESRVLTLTGVGGCGKTRLALQVTANRPEEYPDGRWFVDLTKCETPALVTQALASAVGAQESHGVTLADALARHLLPRKILLILDNCEHVIDECAQVADLLLHACPHLRILATSRQPLGIKHEVTWRAPTLPAPDTHNLPPLEEMAQYEAVQLFLERARFKQPSFSITSQNAPAVARLCRHLDGTPLAIELAAARMRVLSVEQIAERLENGHFDLLNTTNPTIHPRHRTLRGSLDWSYNPLSAPEQTLLRNLSVFPASFTREAAEAICSDFGFRISDFGFAAKEEATIQNPKSEIRNKGLLSSLVDKSLVIEDECEGEVRYRLLETVRHYLLEKLEAEGLAATVHERHANWYLKLAEQAETQLSGPQQEEWFSRLETEHVNFRAALRWAEKSNNLTVSLRLAGALGWFWIMRGHTGEGREWLATALSSPVGPEQQKGFAKTLNVAGRLALFQGDTEGARLYFEQSLALCRSLGDGPGIVVALIGLGHLLRRHGDLAASKALFEESLALARELEDMRGIALSVCGLGNVALQEESYARSNTLLTKSLTMFRQLGDKFGIAYATSHLGYAALRQGKRRRAATLLEKGLIMFSELNVMHSIAECLAALAEVACAYGRYEHAAQLFGAVESLFGVADCSTGPLDQAAYTRSVANARAQLGERVWREAWALGQSMTRDESIRCALEDKSRRRHKSSRNL